MEAKIIEKFTPTLVVAVCNCVRPVADACMADGLITGETRDDILESTVTNEDKTRELLKAVKNCTEIDSISFDIFLRILNGKLPEISRAKLLTDMRTELASEQGRVIAPANESAALVPAFNTGHEAMAPMHHGQLLLSRSHESNVSLLHQEQNPFIGKLEESIREHERTIAEKKLLKEKLKENERLKAQLADVQSLQSSNTSENQSTTTGTSISEADIFQLKEKIEKLEQKSKDLDGEISRYRCAIDIQGGKIIQKLMAEQEKFKNQYEQKFQEFKRSMTKYRELEREHGSYHELDPEEGSAMNYRESEREARRYYGSSDSRGGSDYDVPISKRRKTKSSIDSLENEVTNTMSHANSSVEQLNRPSLRDILMEISASEEEGFLIMERWENIGLQLDIADEKLVAIRRKHTISTTDDGLHHDYNQAFRDMIRVWVKQVNPPPTWLNFVKAFECLNVHHKFTEELRSKYCDSELLKEIMLKYNLSSVSDKEEANKHWYDVGIQLEIDSEKLDEIRKCTQGFGDSRGRFKRIVRAWMKQKKPQPTWMNFVEALEHLDICKSLSAHLRLKYSGCTKNEQELEDPQNVGSSPAGSSS